MNKGLKLLIGIVSVFIVGNAVNTSVFADVTPSKVAVVNVQDVVSSSSSVQALKKEQEAKAKEFVSFIEKARKDVAATSDVSKKKSLEEKYTKELNAKKEANDKAYAKKLAEIDAQISKEIANVAKANGYDIVIGKGIVLYGGNDITEDVKKSLASSEKAAAKKK